MQFSETKTRLLLLPLVLTSILLSSCGSDEILDPSAATSIVILEVVPEGLDAPWTLVTPTAEVIEGNGSIMLKNMVPGTYAVSWGAVPGYDAPLSDRGDVGRDETLTLSAVYGTHEYGTVTLNTEPDGISAGWAVIRGQGDSYVGTEDSTLTGIPSGDYMLVWTAIDDYVIPSPPVIEFTLGAGDSLGFTGTWTLAESGTIQIDPDLEDGPWNLSGPEGYERGGTGDATLASLPLGEYTITWGDVDYYVTPDPETVTLNADQTLVLAAAFALGSGTITLNFDPSDLRAPWSIEGPTGVVQSGSGAASVDVDAGVNILTLGDYDGRLTPEPNTVAIEVAVDEIVMRTFTYPVDPDLTPTDVGTIEIDVSPETASWSLSGPDGFNASGTGDQTFSDSALGDYTVTWQSLGGYITPNPASASGTLVAEGTVEFVGAYSLEPQAGSPEITGLGGNFAHGQSMTISGVDFGSNQDGGPAVWEPMESGSFDSWLGHPHDLELTNESRHANSSGAATANMANGNDAYFFGNSNDLSYRWYYSWWFKLDNNFDWGMGGCAGEPDTENLSNVKFIRMPPPGAEAESITFQLQCPQQLVMRDPQIMNPDGSSLGTWYLRDEHSPHNWPKGRWNHLQVEYKGSSSPGVADGWVRWYINGQLQHTQDNLITRLNDPSGCYPLVLGLHNAHGDASSDRDDFWMDDLYVDTTLARVEIGNAPVYQDCTHREVQIPTSWSNGQITIEANEGSLNSGPRYLFVIDADGNRSAGFPIQ